MSVAVEFSHVSKSFNVQHARSTSLQETFVNFFRRRSKTLDKFWVLNDVSFQLAEGQTAGFIGDNGAGKSTLLKLLCKILEPTSGRVTVSGRIGALLELGSGFHPDLTGRENIYLNGSILGLHRSQIRSRFDEIVAFSELERFIDMPVRNYSSGMMVRLGFAVATSFWPDVLLVDEVLAVGDQVFQSRCLRRISEIQQSGTTIIIVSHDLSVIRRMCEQVFWLEDGIVQSEGDADTVVNRYLASVWKNQQNIESLASEDRGQRWGSGEVRIEEVNLLNSDDVHAQVFTTGDKFVVRMRYQAQQNIPSPAFGISLYDEQGTRINGPNVIWSGTPIESVSGRGYVDYVVEKLPLLPGTYDLTVAVYDRRISNPYDHWHRMMGFVVVPGDNERQDGVVHIPCQWEHHPQAYVVEPV